MIEIAMQNNFPRLEKYSYICLTFWAGDVPNLSIEWQIGYILGKCKEVNLS